MGSDRVSGWVVGRDGFDSGPAETNGSLSLGFKLHTFWMFSYNYVSELSCCRGYFHLRSSHCRGFLHEDMEIDERNMLPPTASPLVLKLER